METNYSIIIPTLNRAFQLKTTLQSAIDLKYDPRKYEIIIVDNGSRDETKELCASIIEDNPTINIKYFFDPIPGLLTGRHKGAQEAKGETLCFLDDDVILSPKWLIAVSETMENNTDIQLMTGPCLPRFESEQPKFLEHFWNVSPHGGRYCGWLSLLDFGSEKVEIDPIFVWGLNFIIRKKTFEDLRGFHPDTMPPKFQKYQGDGETGLSLKAKEKGFKALYVPEAIVYHQVPSARLTLSYFENRFYFQGVCDSYTALRRQNNLYKTEAMKNSNFVRRIIRLAKRLFKKTYNTVFIDNIDFSHRNEIKRRLQKKYHEGFKFHQKAYKNNLLVKKWVLKNDYFDYKLPEND